MKKTSLFIAVMNNTEKKIPYRLLIRDDAKELCHAIHEALLNNSSEYIDTIGVYTFYNASPLRSSMCYNTFTDFVAKHIK